MRHFHLISSILLIIPMNSFAVSFDCNNASTPVEHIICSNSELSSLDDELSQLYKSAVAQNIDIKQSQREWVKNRNLCEFDSCLINSYKDRVDELKWVINDHANNVIPAQEYNAQANDSSLPPTPDATSENIAAPKEAEPPQAESPQASILNEAPTNTSGSAFNKDEGSGIHPAIIWLIAFLIIGAVIYFGITSKCPKCGKWFSADEVGRDLISEDHGRKTVNREDKHKNSRGDVIKTVTRQEQIDIAIKKYNVFHKCSKCNHTWETVDRQEVEL